MKSVNRTVKLVLIGVLVPAIGCGAPPRRSARLSIGSESNSGPYLETKIEGERWYGIPSRCGQGPYEIDLGTLGAHYGEGVELLVHTPRRINLTAVLFLDGQEIVRNAAVLGNAAAGAAPGSKVDNQRCIADAYDIASAVGGVAVPVSPSPDGGASRPPGIPTANGTPPRSGTTSTSVTLQVVDRGHLEFPGLSVIGFSWPSLPSGGHLKIRFWSNLPNDFEDVSFFLLQSAERPNVPEVEYEAYLRVQEEKRQRQIRIELEARTTREREQRVRDVAKAEAEALRLEDVRIQAEIRSQRERRERERRPPPTAAEIERRRLVVIARREEDRRKREATRERRRRAEIKRSLKLELKVKLDLARKARAEQKRRRRKAYCNAHLSDTKCWGAGGYRVTLDLQKRAGEKTAYCKAHQNEARCWNYSEWQRRRRYFRERVALANAPEPEPDGPPPNPLEEVMPPRLSVNADWRPGYWHWARGWIWIAGVWRVPASDLEQNLTTQAPEMPPPAQTEVRPPAPLTTAVWVSGFWQWDSKAWVWVRGSWQLPPSGQVQWRQPSWSARGSVHVLVPGAWIQIGGRR